MAKLKCSKNTVSCREMADPIDMRFWDEDLGGQWAQGATCLVKAWVIPREGAILGCCYHFYLFIISVHFTFLCCFSFSFLYCYRAVERRLLLLAHSFW